jgi:hypothetical protein
MEQQLWSSLPLLLFTACVLSRGHEALGPCHSSGSWWSASHHGDPGSMSDHEGFVVHKVALEQVLPDHFDFPCQFSYHHLLPHSLSHHVTLCSRDNQSIAKLSTKIWARSSRGFFFLQGAGRATKYIYKFMLTAFKNSFMNCHSVMDLCVETQMAPYLNKKFWEELMAYFRLVRHEPHRKRNNYEDTHRQQGDLIIYTRSWGDFYRAVAQQR